MIMRRFLPFAMLAALAASTAMADLSGTLSVLQNRAAEGDGEAMMHLATLYEHGYDSISPDSAIALSYYRKAAESGYAPAQNYLGFLFFNGRIVRQSADSALFWLEKAALTGDGKAANNLGFMLLEGRNVKRDEKKAFFWLSRAAEAGVPAGITQLGAMYEKGIAVAQDSAKARSLYKEAIGKGFHDAETRLLAMDYENYLNLDACRARTDGLEFYLGNAPAIGVTLFEIADSKGDSIAPVLLADAYGRGRGVRYDYPQSLSLYYKGAKAGNPSAQYILGELLDLFPDALDSISASEDEKRAALWYELAARKGITTPVEARRAIGLVSR